MSIKDKNIIVTGGAGYIGSHAVWALLDAGANVTIIDNLTTGHRWAIPGQAEFYEGDINDITFLNKVLSVRDYDAVLHFAGSVVVPESVENPLKYYRNNTAATRSLLEAVVTNAVPYFIFSSTAAVYGVPDIAQVSEETPKNPINPYGMSKLMSEAMLADVSAAHGLSYAALRYFNVSGADPQGRTGQSTDGATHLIKVASEAALGKRDGVAIFGTDYPTADGTGVRDYIHVSDLVSAHVAALEYLMEHPGENLTMNLGYGRGYSVREVLQAVEKVAGVTLNIREEPRRAGDPAELVSSVEKLHATLDWQAENDDLETIISHALAWEDHLSKRNS
ncbi:MAG: UDP-glucose 4-epimerase GalE [Sphingomonadales bacterium]|jgi:UDP-glucose 4-epimerase